MALQAIKETREQPSLWPKTVLIAQPHGFCAGIVRSINASEELAKAYQGQKGYYVGEPAHNDELVKGFRERGVIFVDSVDEVPDGSIVGLGPHGSTPKDLETAKAKKLIGIDTQCPLVTKVQTQAKRYVEQGRTIFYFAKAGHPETRGVLGQDTSGDRIVVFKDLEDLEKQLKGKSIDPDKVAFLTQTTHAANLALDMQRQLKERFPNIAIPSKSDICFATQNRQDALEVLVKAGAKGIVVLGSKHSSNTMELAELAKRLGAKEFFVDGPEELNRENFLGFSSIGITSGASVPENIFQRTLKWFEGNGSTDFKDVINPELKKKEDRMVFGKVEIGPF